MGSRRASRVNLLSIQLWWGTCRVCLGLHCYYMCPLNMLHGIPGPSCRVGVLRQRYCCITFQMPASGPPSCFCSQQMKRTTPSISTLLAAPIIHSKLPPLPPVRHSTDGTVIAPSAQEEQQLWGSADGTAATQHEGECTRNAIQRVIVTVACKAMLLCAEAAINSIVRIAWADFYFAHARACSQQLDGSSYGPTCSSWGHQGYVNRQKISHTADRIFSNTYPCLHAVQGQPQ